MHASQETFVQVFADAQELLEKHWDELAVNKAERPLDIDVDRYRQLDVLGLLKVFTLRDENNKLAGYATFMVMPNLHYKTWVCATCDVYYVDPACRKNGWGKFFFEFIKEQLKLYRVNSIYVHDKLSHSHSHLFKALGFKPIEQTYELVI